MYELIEAEYLTDKVMKLCENPYGFYAKVFYNVDVRPPDEDMSFVGERLSTDGIYRCLRGSDGSLNDFAEQYIADEITAYIDAEWDEDELGPEPELHYNDRGKLVEKYEQLTEEQYQKVLEKMDIYRVDHVCSHVHRNVDVLIVTRYSEMEEAGVSEESYKSYADNSVEVWQTYLDGEVFGYQIFDSSGEELDACWGFYGETHVVEDASDMLQWHINDAKKQQDALREGFIAAGKGFSESTMY